MISVLLRYYCLILFLSPFCIDVQGQSTSNKVIEVDCQCDRERDSLSLLSFYHATNGPKWKNKWDLNEPIDKWYGVDLGPDGCVWTIDMDGKADFSLQRKNGNGLKGNLPDLVLPSLRNLLLASNQLRGSIPDFNHLPHLRILQLSCNNFAGKIPNFAKCPNLKAMELDYNKLEGTIPEFHQMIHLESLYLLGNQLRGSIPDFRDLNKLKYFIANHNKLSGTLPDFRNNPKLRKVMISNNQLDGPLPDFGHLSDLSHLNLANNQLEGSIFDWSFCSDLKYIDLSNNELEGEAPKIRNLSELEVFMVNHNQLAGKVPDPSDLQKLHTFIASHNQFDQAPVIQNTTALQVLSLDHNCLSFADLLPNKPTGTTVFNYAEQSCTGADQFLIGQEDSTLTIAIDSKPIVRGIQYQWFYNGKILKAAPSDQKLQIEKARKKDIGEYYCEMTHPGLPDLFIRSPKTRLLIQSDQQTDELNAIAVEDIYALAPCTREQTIDLLGNDFIQVPEDWTFELLSVPEIGQLEEIANGRFKYQIPETFSGIISFDYQLCHRNELAQCTESYVEIIVPQQKCMDSANLFIPSSFSPNQDGVNDVFYIAQLETDPLRYENNELSIYDIQGRPVFYAKPYQNDWDGTLQNSLTNLPTGIYFYHFSTGKKYEKIQTGPVMISR